MTKLEMLQNLLNDEELKDRIIADQSCDDVRLNVSQTEDNEYLLQVDLIYRIVGENTAVLNREFEFRINNRDSLSFFMLRFNEFVHARVARSIVEIAEIMEDYLKSSLN